MDLSTEAVAWRSYRGAGELYTAPDLKVPEKIKEVFSACKAAEGYITAAGWEQLFSFWNMEELLKMDQGIDWFHSGKPEESAAHLIYQSLMAGYNPISSEKGDYESESGIFLSLEGRKYTIDWDEILNKDL